MPKAPKASVPQHQAQPYSKPPPRQPPHSPEPSCASCAERKAIIEDLCNHTYGVPASHARTERAKQYKEDQPSSFSHPEEELSTSTPAQLTESNITTLQEQLSLKFESMASKTTGVGHTPNNSNNSQIGHANLCPTCKRIHDTQFELPLERYMNA